MAEGWARALMADRIEPHSAGTEPKGLDPRAVRAMAEAGVDISRQRSTPVASLLGAPFDLVVTVCDAARESCPIFPRPVEQAHVSFPDPAEATGSEEERLAVFRAVRDDIRARLLPELARRG